MLRRVLPVALAASLALLAGLRLRSLSTPGSSAAAASTQVHPPVGAFSPSSSPSSSPAPVASSAPAAVSAPPVASAPPCSPLLAERVETPPGAEALLFHVNRWRTLPPDFPVSDAAPWSPCDSPPRRGSLAAELGFRCVPRAYALRSPEALRQIAWDAPAPPSPRRTHDGLPVGHRGRVGFKPLIDAAAAAGHELRIRSGFRSQASQAQIFRSWAAEERRRGFDEVEARRRAAASSAQAGHSEHQLGTTADLVYRDPHASFYEGWEPARIARSPAMQWVADHAHRFGLVLSYGRETTHLTQYVWEPWHYRFVGVEVADALHRCGVPLEVFLQKRYGEEPLPPYELP